MSACPKCGKPVYFAERKTSLGKDWHRACLRCEECGKVLNPGLHAEHKGQPYCNNPCYYARFAPVSFGHGVNVEGHKASTSNKENIDNSNMENNAETLHKVKVYNQYFGENKVGQLNCEEVEDQVMLEGTLRVFWGLSKPIQLRQRDSVPIPSTFTVQDMQPIEEQWTQLTEEHNHVSHNALDNIAEEKTSTSAKQSPILRIRRRGSFDDRDIGVQNVTRVPRRFHTMRVKGEHKQQRRKCSINGHLYNKETCIFTPPHGTSTPVTVTSASTSPDVIQVMLDKFKVETKSDKFSLYIVKDNGETRRLQETEYPLVERVNLGPGDEHAKIFIMEKDDTRNISHEVAQYLNLPERTLLNFLDKFQQEEDSEIERIKDSYQQKRMYFDRQLQKLLKEKEIRTVENVNTHL